MFERFTDRARRCLILALETAEQLNHRQQEVEHLFAGIVMEGEAIPVLRDEFGIDEQWLKERLEPFPDFGAAPPGHRPFTPQMKKALQLALRESLKLGTNYIAPEHLLLGLLREGTITEPGRLLGAVDTVALRRALIVAVVRKGHEDFRAQQQQQQAARGQTPPDPGLLTPMEHRALDLTGELAGLLRRMCAGSQGDNDWNEMAIHIHVIQRTIQSQAAARAYPDRYRLLGRRIGEPE